MFKLSVIKSLIGALYHPPSRYTSQLTALGYSIDYIEAGVDASTAMFPKTTIVLAGDFNSLTRRLRTCLANRSTDAWYKPSKPDIYVHDLSYATVVLLRRRSEAIIKRLSPT